MKTTVQLKTLARWKGWTSFIEKSFLIKRRKQNLPFRMRNAKDQSREAFTRQTLKSFSISPLSEQACVTYLKHTLPIMYNIVRRSIIFPSNGNCFSKQTVRTVSRIWQRYIICHVNVERQLVTVRRRNCINSEQFKDQWRGTFAIRRKKIYSLTPLN